MCARTLSLVPKSRRSCCGYEPSGRCEAHPSPSAGASPAVPIHPRHLRRREHIHSNSHLCTCQAAPSTPHTFCCINTFMSSTGPSPVSNSSITAQPRTYQRTPASITAAADPNRHGTFLHRNTLAANDLPHHYACISTLPTESHMPNWTCTDGSCYHTFRWNVMIKSLKFNQS